MFTDSGTCLRKLSHFERQQYNEFGFVIVPDVFGAEELAALNGELDRIIESGKYQRCDAMKSGKPAGEGCIMDLTVSRKTQEFAQEPRLAALVEDLVQPGLAIHSSKLVAKAPHSGDICHWHQDEAYYTAQRRRTTTAARSGFRCGTPMNITAACGSCPAATAVACSRIVEWIGATCRPRPFDVLEPSIYPTPSPAGYPPARWSFFRHGRGIIQRTTRRTLSAGRSL